MSGWPLPYKEPHWRERYNEFAAVGTLVPWYRGWANLALRDAGALFPDEIGPNLEFKNNPRGNKILDNLHFPLVDYTDPRQTRISGGNPGWGGLLGLIQNNPDIVRENAPARMQGGWGISRTRDDGTGAYYFNYDPRRKPNARNQRAWEFYQREHQKRIDSHDDYRKRHGPVRPEREHRPAPWEFFGFKQGGKS